MYTVGGENGMEEKARIGICNTPWNKLCSRAEGQLDQSPSLLQKNHFISSGRIRFKHFGNTTRGDA